MPNSITISLTPVTPPVSTVSSDARRGFVTAYDMIARCLSGMGGNPKSTGVNDIRRGIGDAYKELVNCHPWTYLNKLGRIFLQATESEGTVEYDHTGGAYERLLTLTDSTWPSWAENGYVRIGTVCHLVQYRIDSARLQLEADSNPGEDVDAGTTYTITQDTYLLPEDWANTNSPMPEEVFGGLSLVSPALFNARRRFVENESGTPQFCAIVASRKRPTRLAIAVCPAVATFQTLDFTYKRKPRDITTWELKDGKASITSGSQTVTLSQTGALKARMRGSVIRFSDTAVDLPTATDGDYPFAEEREIIEILSDTQATLDEPVTATYTNVAYRISDPIDIDVQSMLNALTAGIAKQLAASRQMKPAEAGTYQSNWLLQLNIAKAADYRDSSTKQASLWGARRQRLADMPRGGDLE